MRLNPFRASPEGSAPPMDPVIEVVAELGNRCGEAPLWDADRQRLVWSDHESGFLFEHRPAGGTTGLIHRGEMVFGTGLNRTGELLFSGPRGLLMWPGAGEARAVAGSDRGEPLVFNDMLVGPRGGVYAGTVHWDWARGARERLGRLYLIEPSGGLRVVDEGLELSNGLGFSPDGRVLYCSDSAARVIYAFDVHPETGELTGKRSLVRIPADEGLPDGLTVDTDGFLWSAQWYGGAVVRYDPDGAVARRLRFPVQQISSVAFGGPDLTDLYVTSAGEYWRSPLAPPGYGYPAGRAGGSLYRVRLDVAGRPEYLADFPTA
jgi:D-xylonolactonase